ncbi:hypothetical protein [Patulibacter sp. SYSU D01012]|uniref:hypothetical protein n=1 Tax=Patulibacter sp. SYSU D01012 TaxID=2817381 RepID=UPI001B303B31|nr:hypothetical protein [Patulibacter sp. SYSU D01012]
MSETPLPAVATPAEFDPDGFAAFRFVGVEIDEEAAAVTLRYALDDAVAFAETVAFDGVTWPRDPARRETLARLARLLHLLAGVSYFKTAVPARMVLEPGTGDLAGGDAPSPRLRALLREVYTLGLGEFAYRNGIDVRERGAWPAAAEAAPAAPVALDATGRTLVPIGGGKDSVVALEVVRRAGREALPFSVGRAEPIVRCVQASGLPHAVARRSLSPNIGAINAAGAHNGHVPVTAVVSTIALMTAVLHGADAVAMANERSASEGNLVWDGLDVNHQWSKGAAFETAYRDLLAAEVATGLDYRSVLRPASELAIARAFSRLTQYHPHFTSCNTVFRLDPARRRSHWCGDCPKCRFVFLALAPELQPDALRSIFGVDMLDDETQYAGFCDLAGLRHHKPFECVGEEAESLVAMRLIAGQAPADVAVLHPGAQGAWADHAVVRRLRAEHLDDRPTVHPAELAPPYVLDEAALADLPSDLRDAAVAVLAP